MSTCKLHVWILKAWKVIHRQAQKSVHLKIKGSVLKKKKPELLNPPMSLFLFLITAEQCGQDAEQSQR